MNYVFELTPMDTAALQEQLARALETRTELMSRAKYPGLWKRADKNRDKKPILRPSRRRTRILSVINLALGLLLLIPGLMQPKELLIPLLVGTVGVGAGIGGLWRSRKNKPDRFAQPAAKLLRGRDRLAPGSCTVTFDNTGITVLQDGKQARAPWTAFHCIVETQDLLLAAYDTRATVLAKSDLQGSMDTLRDRLQKKTVYRRI